MRRALKIRVVVCLIGSMLLAASVRAQQEEEQDRRRYMIGLLEIPSVLGPFMSLDSERPTSKRAVKIYSAPTAQSKIIAVIDDPEKIASTKLSSEEIGAPAYKKRDGWYLIGLEEGNARGWISPTDAGAFIPVDRLFIERLAYLNEHWDKRLWSLPERGSSSRRLRLKGERTPPEYDVNITGTKRVGGKLWLRVEVLGPGRCRGLNEPRVIARGWVPAFTPRGELIAWYYSGGC